MTEPSSDYRRVFTSFPGTPYGIQEAFMTALFEALSLKRIGLFESPTGSGKTLSLICGALEWLELNREITSSDSKSQSDDDAPPWIMEQFQRMSCNQRQQRRSSRDKRIERTRSRLDQKRQRHQRDQDLKFLLSDVGDEALVSSDDDSGASEDGKRDRRQIIICSRTHSQLSQFIGSADDLVERESFGIDIGEFKKTPFAQRLSVVTLASRKALCLNHQVKRLESNTALNEKCLELKRTKPAKKNRRSSNTESSAADRPTFVKTGGSCPYLQKRDASESKRHTDMIHTVLSEPMDIETLGQLGERLSVCPYYATRTAVKDADLILLPYSSLLSAETRESLGVELEGNVVIIDEGHNLVDAINNTYRAVIDGMSVKQVSGWLEAYLSKFELRLTPSNCENVKILIRICHALMKYLNTIVVPSPQLQAISVDQLLFDAVLDDLNLLRIVRWMKDTRLPYKISNDSDPLTTKDSEKRAIGSVYALSSFLAALHNEDRNGCIIASPASDTSASAMLSFVLLHPAVHFEKILEASHSVILASGTLSPLSLIKSQLFSRPVQLERIASFSCSHIVPKERVLALALNAGPSGRKLNLKFENRSNEALIEEIGRMVLNFCSIIPQGIVIFVPSFAYLETLRRHFRGQKILERLQTKKSVFFEPRGAQAGEQCFREYKSVCDESAKGGGLLFGVVGGKMSEGINFGDGLGRCVLVIGLPFPNRNDPELIERMKYINKNKDSVFHLDSRQYYEDLCMKSVNQSIGRVIRHIRDYACIVLADERYGQPSIMKKLPQWIQPSFEGSCTFKEAFMKCNRFFKAFEAEVKEQSLTNAIM